MKSRAREETLIASGCTLHCWGLSEIVSAIIIERLPSAAVQVLNIARAERTNVIVIEILLDVSTFSTLLLIVIGIQLSPNPQQGGVERQKNATTAG